MGGGLEWGGGGGCDNKFYPGTDVTDFGNRMFIKVHNGIADDKRR